MVHGKKERKKERKRIIIIIIIIIILLKLYYMYNNTNKYLAFYFTIQHVSTNLEINSIQRINMDP
jgi:uncharacterized integral membrane protein